MPLSDATYRLMLFGSALCDDCMWFFEQRWNEQARESDKTELDPRWIKYRALGSRDSLA